MLSEPVTGDRFFGREEVLELLQKRVLALKDGYRQNIAFSGQSLSGKSSILLHFLRCLRNEGFVPVYVEVVRETFKSFAEKFIATMLNSALEKEGVRPEERLEPILEVTRENFPKTYIAVKQTRSAIERGATEEAYSLLLSLTSVLKAECGIPFVVIFDEFDNFESLGVKNPFIIFGKAIMVQRDTMYIVSSSRDAAIRKIISEKLSLLFGNFEIVKIGNFDLATSERFIDMKLAEFDIEKDMKRFLVELAGGNPFYLDKLTSRCRKIAVERMTSFVDKDNVSQAVLELVYNCDGTIHQYLMNLILEVVDSRYRQRYLSMLALMTQGNRKAQEIAKSLKIRQTEAAKALTHMVELGLISKTGIFYRIESAMLEFWVKDVYLRRRESLIGGAFDKEASFKNDMLSHIESFETEQKLDATARVAELFNAFSNELVNICGKNIRLPRFSKVEIKRSPSGGSFIAASFKGNLWIAQAYERPVSEGDIVDYLRNARASDQKISNKIILALNGIDENSRLIAKELRMSIWDAETMLMLSNIYGKKSGPAL